jgi:CHASE1-domain containing sensor protein
MSPTEIVALALAALCLLSGVGLLHVQNQLNRLKQSQRELAESVSVALSSMIQYVDTLQKEGK